MIEMQLPFNLSVSFESIWNHSKGIDWRAIGKEKKLEKERRIYWFVFNDLGQKWEGKKWQIILLFVSYTGKLKILLKKNNAVRIVANL